MADFDFSTLITNRAQADLDALRDLLATPMAEWTAEQMAQFNQASSRGAYNYTDLNRVTQCMGYINEKFIELGYNTGYQKIKIPHQGDIVLPGGYTRLAYIHGDGAQYIDTGFKPNQDTSVIVDAQLLSVDVPQFFFGCRTSPSYTVNYSVLLTGQGFRSDYGKSKVLTSAIPATDRVTIKRNKNICFINSVEIENAQSAFQCPYNMFVFASNDGGSANFYSTANIYSFTLYDGDSIIRDYVPAKNSGGVTGLYDLVNDTFYQNAGTGVFTAGPVVTSLDPYTWYEEDTPTNSQMVQYISNINALRSVLPIAIGTPDTPGSMESLTFEEANAIERILGEIEIVINSMSQIFLRSGTPWVVSGALNPHFAN